jgi:hypothetical protein
MKEWKVKTKPNAVKLAEENIGDMGLGKIFFNVTPKVHSRINILIN